MNRSVAPAFRAEREVRLGAEPPGDDAALAALLAPEDEDEHQHARSLGERK